jgi:predicted MPP superfamily phosphohydrolase
LLVAAFIAVIASVLAGGHWYLAQRFVWQPEPPAWLRRLLLATLTLGVALLVAQPIAERVLPRRLGRWIAWPASLWMGFAFYLLIASIAFTYSASSRAAVASGAQALSAPAGGGRRCGGSLRGAVGLRSALAPPRLTHVEIALQRWPAGLDGYRIVQLSDLHIGPLLDRRFAADLVKRCNQLAPDLIAVTGDLVDGSVARVAAEVAPLEGLRARHGVWFVTGNHDYYSGADAWAEHARGLGFGVLRNRRLSVGDGDAIFDLAGVEDHHAHLVSETHREDLAAALDGRDRSRACVLLAHDPATFKRAAQLGVDLQLSGHTHGGQIWPFRYLVRLSTPYVAGLYRAGDSQLYVSCGTGFWGPAMRVLAPAEITEIVLRRA